MSAAGVAYIVVEMSMEQAKGVVSAVDDRRGESG